VYDVRLRDPAGRVYTRTFSTKREAEHFEADEKVRKARREWIPLDQRLVPFDELAERWLEVSDDKRPRSLVRDKGIVIKHLVPAFNARPVVSITSEEVQRLVNKWARTHAPAGVNRMYSTLRAILNFAVAIDARPSNPCKRIRLPQAYPRTARILDADALADLAVQLGDSGPMVYLAVQGLRWGEIAGLRVRHLDLLRHRIVVEQQRTRGEGSAMVEHEPKTVAGARPVDIPAWLSEMLAEHLRDRGLTAADRDAHLFTGPTGAPLRYDNWRARVWLPAVKAADLDGFRFHDLKHTAGTALVEDGVDVKTAQARLGHASPVTTLKIYAQATAEANRKAADLLGERFRPRDRRAMDPKVRKSPKAR
jgi:integrase